MNSYDNEFIKFDTIKIRTKKEYLINRFVEFRENRDYTNGNIIGIDYISKNDKSIPYNLYIAVSYPSQSLTLEFSSKVLLDDYPKLITHSTFKQCINNINKLGICTLDTDAIYRDCYITGDVTKDIEYQLSHNDYCTLNRCVGNYRLYKWEHYENQGIRFFKDVTTKKLKESLVIYDKEKEIEKNKDFLSMVDNSKNIIDYFKGKTRFEIVLDKEYKMKKYLNIPTTHINNVFTSKANPLLIQFNKIFGNGEIMDTSNIKNAETYEMMKNLQSCDGNLKQIEQELKDYNIYSSRSGLTEKMKKYKQLHTEMYNKTHNSSNILTSIRQKLT
ncbi:hypothetical protein [Dysgonomonas sp. GY617]|uniref:hypothetical protein n=1 Tax=Dysgonomonas sp. GY617 TaxID=2780420 RepID=UPI0018848CDD|nr:hypothetical protein [Dysgonomonas sp. GY617]MBF0576438.1 hypothetical protein [Dysgonomonas sp. GY617]